MKKLFSIALSMLMLISCFAISVSAEEVNYAQNENASYSFAEDLSSSWNGSMADDACELLTDGNIPYMETPFESVSVQGTSQVVNVVFDLGAIYPDIKQIKFCGVWNSYEHGSSGQNRGFTGDKTLIGFSQGGEDFEGNKDFEMTKENWSEDGSENGWYNYIFTFNEDVTARKIELKFWSPVYVLTLGEIQIIGGGAAPVEPESSEEESSEEESLEESVEEPAESTDESVAESEAEESTEESKAEESKAEESKAEESKAEESKTESKTDTSSDNKDDKDGPGPLVIVIIIIVAVVVIATVVIIIMKKRG